MATISVDAQSAIHNYHTWMIHKTQLVDPLDTSGDHTNQSKYKHLRVKKMRRLDKIDYKNAPFQQDRISGPKPCPASGPQVFTSRRYSARFSLTRSVKYWYEQAGAGRDGRTCLARPKSQARTGTGIFFIIPVQSPEWSNR